MKKLISFLLVISLLTLIDSGCSRQKQTLIRESVKTEYGLVSGVYSDSTGVTAFKGIPFAAPPVGDLRWKAPQPAESWEGVRKCTRFSASPMQNTPGPLRMWTQEFMPPKEPLSEDCLYLNVWTGAKGAGEKRPVLVYIYGGGFTGGSNSVPLYDGEEMAKKGLVFVVPNYRVGPFGFLAHPELTAESGYNASGNYALLDQIEALKWVQKNIEAFGGDPENVTIAGQSAGAFSVNYLVASPLAKGLFQHAIAESGGAVLSTSRQAGLTLKQAEQAGVRWAESLGANSIAELRAMPAAKIQAARGPSSPVVDGYVVPEQLNQIFAEGKQNDVPLILGWNKDEGIFNGPFLKAVDFVKQIKNYFGDKAGEFLQLIPVNNDDDAHAAQELLGSLQIFGLQSYEWMLLQNKTGKSKVYIYNFERDVPYGEGMKDYGAFHSGELPYAYDNLHMSPRPWTAVDYRLADTMSSYWVNFAKNGDPNGKGLPEWLFCSPSNLKAMIFNTDVHLADLPDQKILDFLEQFYTTRLKDN